MSSIRLIAILCGILVLAVVAKTYHVKITKHSSPKSRDLSRQQEEGYQRSYFPVAPPDPVNDVTKEADDSDRSAPGGSKEKRESSDPLHEDYGSHEYDGDDNGVPTGNSKQEFYYGLKKTQEKEKIDRKKEGNNVDDVAAPKAVKKPYDACDSVYCHYGRVCKSYPDGAATCECADESYCAGHSKRVCGSDGVWYSSHCELHRQACLTLTHISVDHEALGCDSGHLQKEKSKPKEVKKSGRRQEVSNHDDDEEIDDVKPMKREYANHVTPVKKSQMEIEIPSNDVMTKKAEKVKDEKQKKTKKKSKKGKKKTGKKHSKKNLTPTTAASTESPRKADVQDTDNVILDNHRSQVKHLEVPSSSPTAGGFSPTLSRAYDAVEFPCTRPEFDSLKNNLLLYHCARIGEKDCYNLGNKKQFLANIMFHYYDRSADDRLDAEELTDIEHRDHLGKLSQYCHLADIFQFDDADGDDNITVHEFYSAFGISSVSLDAKLNARKTTINAGNTLELKCDITGTTETIWKRNGAPVNDLPSDDIRVFEDGSLYIGHVMLHHLGNYTCQDIDNDEVVQTHILRVQMPPKVKVHPDTQFHTTGSSVTLHCHVTGIPRPEITWEKNETPLVEDPQHYTLLYKNATLEIRTAEYTTDTGAYKCTGRNTAGRSHDIGTIFIENERVPKYSQGKIKEEFLVFHDNGFTVYEPDRCNMEHQVSGLFSDFVRLPLYGSTVPTLCSKGQKCSWGGAVNVKDDYVYVTQPKLNRVVVVDVRNNHSPVELIQTDVTPVSIHYVAHLDQVWVVCWNGEEDGAAKTVVVIRDADQEIQHHTVHTQPIGDRFDLIKELFLPPSNDLDQPFDYGYVLHDKQQELYKVDLLTLKYVNTIDLEDYDCRPTKVTFLPIGGKVTVYCSSPEGAQEAKSSRLVLDYITDKVLEHSELGGEPFVSPDSNYMVTVDRDTNTLAVYTVSDEGNLHHVFEEYTSFRASDVTFFPSEHGSGYDLYATSADRNDLLFINLASGKIEMIEGVGEAIDPRDWLWSKKNRVIVGSRVFGEYLMTPSKDAVLVIDGKRRHVQCEWRQVHHGNVIVWVKPKRTL